MAKEDEVTQLEPKDIEKEDLSCIWDHNYSFCGVTVKIREDYDAGLGGTLFDGALCICNYIETLHKASNDIFKNKTVIELGAGCGLPGILTYKLGGNVILTDIEETIELLEENIESNIIEKNENNLIAKELDWLKDEQLTNFEKYDFILAADTVYSVDCIIPFLSVLKALSKKETKIIFAHPAPREPKASEKFWNLLSNSDEYKFKITKVEPKDFVPNLTDLLSKGKLPFSSETKGVFVLEKIC